ncbi:MAG: hypothetical protein MZW92_00790 [Comamonadaceae bacterium]|nr:hypothetical protein [Comamonadaceae bacterium]
MLNDDVADLAIGADALNVARRMPQADRHVREGRWATPGSDAAGRARCRGARMGLVGMGRIGQAIAHRAAAFGMVDRLYRAQRQAGAALSVLRARRRRWPPRVDFLVVITPGGAGTRKLIDADVLRGAAGPKGYPGQRGARLGGRRGGADRGAGSSGAIAGAGARRVRERAAGARARCVRCDNVVLTPHIGSATRAHAPGHGRPGVREPAGLPARQPHGLAGAGALREKPRRERSTCARRSTAQTPEFAQVRANGHAGRRIH